MDTMLWLSLTLILWQACEMEGSYWGVLFSRDIQRAYWQKEVVTAAPMAPAGTSDKDRREYHPPRGAA